MHLNVWVILEGSSEVDLALGYPEALALCRCLALVVDSMIVGQGHFLPLETMETSFCYRSDKDYCFEALDCYQRYEVSV